MNKQNRTLFCIIVGTIMLATQVLLYIIISTGPIGRLRIEMNHDPQTLLRTKMTPL